VCVAKESTGFFSDSKVFAQGIDWYESQFKDCPPEIVIGELVSEYLQNIASAGLIARTLPQAQLLAVIENPLLAVRVAYIEARKNNLISSKISLAQFLKDNPQVLQSVRQGRQLTQYFEYYSPTDLLVFTADDIRDNPINSLSITFAHIGVDPKFVPLSLRYLVEEDEPDPKKRPGIIKRTFRLIKKLLTWPVRSYVRYRDSKILPVEIAFDVARKIPINKELSDYLKDYYREDVAVLSRLLHRSLTHEWGFDE
jgi:hypothetical protein